MTERQSLNAWGDLPACLLGLEARVAVAQPQIRHGAVAARERLPDAARQVRQRCEYSCIEYSPLYGV